MKTTDIQVGLAYVYQDHKHGLAQKVEVLETGVARVTAGWSNKMFHDGIRVKRVAKNMDNKTKVQEFVVQARQIIRPWDEYEKQVAEEKLRREKAEVLRRERVKVRLANIRILHDALVAKNVPSEPKLIYVNKDVDLIREAFAGIVEDEETGPGLVMTTPLADPVDAIRNGRLDLSDGLGLL